VTLTAHDQSGAPQMTKHLSLDQMGPGYGGFCDNIGQRSTALKLVSGIQAVFPQFSNTQCIAAVIFVYCILVPSFVLMVTTYVVLFSKKEK
jgi:hypothetical protein